LVTFRPIARRPEIKSSGHNDGERGQRPKYPQRHHRLDDSVGKPSIADILLSANGRF
jgi:hypothetical protein